MKKIGITGQSGFIGTHLYNYFGLKEDIERIPFEDSYFENENKLKEFVQQCDVIVHLAAMNRHNDPQVIYDTNIRLVKQLIDALEYTGVTSHILFSSSTQEEQNNFYGRSKKDGREMLINWAKKNRAMFTGMIIPNVFGPFGQPFYNSVIATFCHQLTHGEQPEIHIDGQLKLIYINELVEEFYRVISNGLSGNNYTVNHTSEKKVSEILLLLNNIKSQYFEKGIIPNLNNTFELYLFNTFVCYIDLKKHFPIKLQSKKDDRGFFAEIIKSTTGGQVSFSTTKPGITRGNHYHTRKAERFAVIKGKARIQLRRIGTNEILNFELSGDEPAFVDMPVWYTHNITNIGTDELYTIFWVNEFFNTNDPDTYYEKV